MPPALPVLRVVAPHRNVGKTLLASRLIAELSGRGYVVAALKHSHHPVMPDRPGSDTDRFVQAGAAVVTFCGGDGTLVRYREPVRFEAAVATLTGEADVVIAEGFKDEALGGVIALTPGDPVSVRFTSMDGALVLSTTARDICRLVGAVERVYQMSAAGSAELRRLVRAAAARHGHLCPGVTLGVHMVQAGLDALGLTLPPPPQRLTVTVEVARCATDAIAAVTGCSVGRGNLRVSDHGVMAAIFTDTATGQSARVAAREGAREPAACWTPPDVCARHHRQQVAYRVLPDSELLVVTQNDALSSSGIAPAGGCEVRV